MEVTANSVSVPIRAFEFMQDINAFLENRLQCVRADNEEIHSVFNRCESPIERDFFLAYLWLTNPYPMGDGTLIDRMDHISVGAFVCIEPQRQIVIDGASYRADFSFDLCLYSESESRNMIKRLVVEIDGHEFHERTKEQAARDRSRDRAMARAGIQVIRFTGSEIYKSAVSAAIEARRLLSMELYARAEA